MSVNLTTGGMPALAEEANLARHGLVRRLLKDPLSVICLAFMGLLVLAAVLAPLLITGDPMSSKLADTLAPPFTSEHPLGADGVGRDVLAQLLYGAQTSLVSAAIVMTVSTGIGVPLGILAGYYRGWFDATSSWISNALMALPAIVVLLVVLARVGRSTPLALAVFGILISPAAFQLVRGSVRAVREELYIDAARVSGLSNIRIMSRHVLPVVVAPSIIQASQVAAAGIGIEAGIAFLGLGTADHASWGLMLNDASQNIFNAPWLLIWPTITTVLTILVFALLGNAIRDAVGGSPKVRRRRAHRGRRGHRGGGSTPGGSEVEAGAVIPTPEDGLLSVANLRVAYDRPEGDETVVVHDVSLTVRKGQVLGLVGESGSGKSQTAFAILGLLSTGANTSATSMVFDGQNLADQPGDSRNQLRGRRIGYIPQEPMSNLDPSYTIGFQLVEPMKYHLRISAKEAKQEALRLLERVGISSPGRVFDSYPHEISGGMAQRVLIAGAVSCNPDLLIADEPTTALDVTVQAEVLDLIRDLQAERGMAVILVTHNFGVVADLCDTVAVMRSGRVVEAASATDLFANPKHEYTRMLLDSTMENAPARRELTTMGTQNAIVQDADVEVKEGMTS
ncbi:dipeptide/oligopeptide/nickel ABC transporter permease/ATP-binding protein [Pseudarthrobacter sp. YAF2]|uniref:dipeptide/oligopeptide/nickel ABC transporter permease/ATP-binding protein n=1 Tax=Pseudarthrobacter sp. YAF2 TaxID=3233078 RepID=UPI003F95743D